MQYLSSVKLYITIKQDCIINYEKCNFFFRNDRSGSDILVAKLNLMYHFRRNNTLNKSNSYKWFMSII